MLVLKPFEVCKYGGMCPFRGGCYGLKSDREKEFKCELIAFDGGTPYFPKDKNLNKNEFQINNSNKKILHG